MTTARVKWREKINLADASKWINKSVIYFAASSERKDLWKLELG